MKRKSLLTRTASAMIVSAACATPVMAQLQYYGYYEADDGRFGHYGQETYGHSNFLHIAPLSHDFFRQRIAQATTAGQRIFFDTDTFFKSRDPLDWATDFPSYASIVAPYKDHIAAVFVVDEPFLSGPGTPNPATQSYTTAQVQDMISVINTNLPGVKTLINFIPASTDHWARPSNLDYVGTTNYPWYSANNGQPVSQQGPQNYADFQSGWTNSVNKVRNWSFGGPYPAKDMWVVGAGAQGVPGEGSDGSQYPLPNPPYANFLAYPTATQAQWYRDILAEPGNSDVKGFSWYTYTNEYTVLYGHSDPTNRPYQTGSRAAPASLRTFQQNWGNDVGHLSNLGPVHVQAASFETPGTPAPTFSPTNNTGMGIRSDAWFASPVFPGEGQFNISGISLRWLAGNPDDFTVKIYKVPANTANIANSPGSNRPDNPDEPATLVATQEFNGVSWNFDETNSDLFTYLPLSAPVAVQPGAKYLMTVEGASDQPNGNSYWYLWGRRSGGGVAFSSNQGVTWTAGMPDQGVFTNWQDASIEYRLSMREEFNPAIDVRQDGEQLGRSLERTDWVGQSFSPGQTNITGFSFGGASYNTLNLNGGQIYARLYVADGAGKPSGAPIFSQEVPISELGGFPMIDFGRAIAFESAVQYVATLETDGAGITGDWLAYFVTSNPLASGQALHSTNQGGTWSAISGPEDWKFRTFFQPMFFFWENDVSGDWSPMTNWVGGIPDTMDATAYFGNRISAPRIVTVDTAMTVGTLSFDSAHSYTVAGSNAVTLDVLNGDAHVNVYSGSHTVSAPVQLNDSVAINVAASASITLSGGLTGSSVTAVTKSGDGDGHVKFVRAGALAVTEGTLRVLPDGTSAGTSRVTSVTVSAGAKLDMTDNDFIVDYAEGDPSPEFVLRDYVKAFADNPAATSGIDFTHGANDVTIAVAEKTEWGFSTFNGVALDDTTIVGKYTYYGDANLDGAVTSDDYVAVDVGLGTGDSWVQGDFNFSGSVTSDDYVAIDVNLGKGSPTPLAFAELKAEMIALHTAMFGDEYVQKLALAEAEGFAALVPEPGALSLIGLGAMRLLARRRRARRAV